MDLSEIKQLLLGNEPAFWSQLRGLTGQATAFEDLIVLSSMRKKAVARGLARPEGASQHCLAKNFGENRDAGNCHAGAGLRFRQTACRNLGNHRRRVARQESSASVRVLS